MTPETRCDFYYSRQDALSLNTLNANKQFSGEPMIIKFKFRGQPVTEWAAQGTEPGSKKVFDDLVYVGTGAFGERVEAGYW